MTGNGCKKVYYSKGSALHLSLGWDSSELHVLESPASIIHKNDYLKSGEMLTTTIWNMIHNAAFDYCIPDSMKSESEYFEDLYQLVTVR